MLDFIRIACAVPPVKLADPAKNAEDICKYIASADQAQADILEFCDKLRKLQLLED